MPKPHNNGSIGERLRYFCERIEGIVAEKDELNADLRDTMKSAREQGFDPKILKHVLKLRSMGAYERREYIELCEIYAAVLFGTSMSDGARARLAGRHAPPTPPHDPDEPPLPFGKPGGDDDTASPSAGATAPAEAPEPGAETSASDSPAPKPSPAGDTEADATAKGEAAARSGEPILANPYPPGHPLRVLWDVAWCRATGSDGMDIPQQWRRQKKKPEKKDCEGGDDTGDDDGKES